MQGFLAVDVAKDALECALAIGIADSGKALPAVPNTPKGYRTILRQCRQEGVTELLVCMEATGGYWQKLATFLYQKGIKVAVVNPARIKAQRRTEQTRSKTDRVDALVILRFLKSQLPNLFWWQPPTDAIRRLQSLVRYREMCVGQRTALCNLLSSQSAHDTVERFARTQLEEMERRIEQLNGEIAAVIRSDDRLSSKLESITSIDSIADVTAAVLLAEARGFAEIRDPRQATAFAGLDVIEESSGKMRKPSRISKQGNRLLRVAFIRIAPSACHRKGVWRELYRKFLAKGLHKRQAHVAVARKMLEVAVAIGVSESKYDRDKHIRALGLPCIA